MSARKVAEAVPAGGGLAVDPEHQQRIDELAERLADYRAKYYAGTPLVSDAAYDALEDELRQLAPAHPLLAKVGSPVLVEAWDKARHVIPMGSLNKVVSESELRDWVARCDELLGRQGLESIASDLFIAEKLDGISVELLYRDGRLADGITRGDGEVGERITVNVARMRGVPPTIAEKRAASVRGEIILRLSDMRSYFPDAVSPRNAAAGTARRLDGVGNEHLTVLVYDLAGDFELETEQDKFAALRRLGFATPNTYAGSLEEVLALHAGYGTSRRAELDYEIDGLVVRPSRLETQRLLGELNRRPRGAVAFKFASPAKVTEVVAIEWDTGPSGRVTPVAVVQPVHLAGATVQRASLHNASRVRSLGIGPGDEVLVSRRNDVIPYVEEVVTKRGHDVDVPAACARCEGPLVREGEYLLCRNDQCAARVEGRIRNWIDAIGALEWGERLVEQVVAAGLVRQPVDLYSLEVADLARLDRQGDKSASNALEQLRARLPLSLPVFLAALGIEGFGIQTARLLVEAGFRDLDSLQRAEAPELAAIKGIGEAKATAILRGLAARSGEIDALVDAGIVPTVEPAGGALEGQTFCITGKLSRPRKELAALIEQHGGRVLSSVTADLDYLVIADPSSTSSKAVKARKLGTALLDEARLMDLLSG
ncbi:MAG: NAD-dependent DNA ligase LigA [Deltaproteobacteria bacterium]|nr:NAD-dependent DNA ligase LigA [Deltaproteobacteria bacterium]MBW2535575.1 NAD-dependent DNA ligase LigA [Deltaproteobacteria bacterium]